MVIDSCVKIIACSGNTLQSSNHLPLLTSIIINHDYLVTIYQNRLISRLTTCHLKLVRAPCTINLCHRTKLTLKKVRMAVLIATDVPHKPSLEMMSCLQKNFQGGAPGVWLQG